jgi:hypothetical protein
MNMYKHMKTEKFTLEWLVDHQRNKGGDHKIPRIKGKWKQKVPEPSDTAKVVMGRKFIAV